MSKFTPRERQKSNRVLSQMDGEKRRRVRKLATTTASSRENPLATYLYTTPGPGSWTKPDFGTKVEIWACGGGGGGGSGRKGAVGTIRGGGAGGAGGAPAYLGTYDIAEFVNQVTFDIGAGGAGGAPQTTNSTNGSAGAAGGDTTITVGGRQWVSFGANAGGVGGSTSATATTPVVDNSSVNFSSIFRFSAALAPGGNVIADESLTGPLLARSMFGVETPSPGSDGVLSSSDSGPFPLHPLVSAPRGGLASVTGNGQKGGDGVLGLGGSGGGAATNDVGDSGAGGRGGDGFVYFIVY